MRVFEFSFSIQESNDFGAGNLDEREGKRSDPYEVCIVIPDGSRGPSKERLGV